jgi:ribosomal protein L29
MIAMKIVDIRKLSTTDLATETNKLQEEIVELRRRVSLGEIQNVRIVKNKRKDLARMLTVLSEQLMKEAK